jgi:hypothetical protein
MFIYTIKASKLKFFAALFCAFGVLALLIALVPDYDDYADVAAVSYKFDGIDTNEERIAFLEQFGYKISKEPNEIVDVVIPEEFDSVYTEYNDIQREQGLNLKKYKGKTATRYTYTINEYPGYENGEVIANLLIYKSKIIGGDICCVGEKSFLHGFEKPEK